MTIEARVERAEIEDVGLRIFDIAQTRLAGLACRIGEAGPAEIDRQHTRAGEALRGLDRMLAGAAAGDQHIEAFGILNAAGSARPGTGCAGTSRCAIGWPRDDGLTQRG